uniref:16S rRNA methyltransferase n=1 Tax=uncultured bacterium pAM1 TaxID=1781153 RepID=A0A1C9U4W8_9BACT|nr:16S rRNA methyltransferase [uncultured bacterium pAM1]
MKQSPQPAPSAKSGIHPRNRNSDRYDFPLLLQKYPDFGQFVFINKYGKETIDFANPAAVRMLNKVLLHHYYNIRFWELPPDHLCPPIPGRADYLHYLADLLSSENLNSIPRGPQISVLDIGVGASCIYPLIGNAEYGWRFVGTDSDPSALISAQRILDGNSIAADRIELRTQTSTEQFFRGIIKPGEQFDLTMCNPPFHESAGQAIAGTKRKWKNLGIQKEFQASLNFGGRHNELVYPGGEINFVQRMVNESITVAQHVAWFTSLISKQSNLPILHKELKRLSAAEIRIVDMAQGQKKSRFIAWTFLDGEARKRWRSQRRTSPE